MIDALFDKGWVKFPKDATLAPWIEAAREAAIERVNDPDERRVWLHCEGTWFVGVDTLPSDAEGAVGQAGPLTGMAYHAAREIYGSLPLHPGQVSVMYPGYPRPRDGESEAAFRYREKWDAAHVDGLLGVGHPKKRMLKEQHAYILGLPLTACDDKASPLVVWEGSHTMMKRAFDEALAHRPPDTWADVDLTAIYQATRAEAFETCPRVKVTAEPGEAYLVHRLALHGVAPWEDGAEAPDDGRMIAYFRPELPPDTRGWLDLP